MYKKNNLLIVKKSEMFKALIYKVHDEEKQQLVID